MIPAILFCQQFFFRSRRRLPFLFAEQRRRPFQSSLRNYIPATADEITFDMLALWWFVWLQVHYIGPKIHCN